MKALFQSVVTLVILTAIAGGCKSGAQRNAGRDAVGGNEAAVGAEQKEAIYEGETLEEKIGRAQWELKRADDTEDLCDRLVAYAAVGHDFPGTHQASIAEKKRKQTESAILKRIKEELAPRIEDIISRSGRNLELSGRVDELVPAIRQSLNSYERCQSNTVTQAVDKVKTRLERAEDKRLAERLKYHGY